jgi:hypothetical protein
MNVTDNNIDYKLNISFKNNKQLFEVFYITDISNGANIYSFERLVEGVNNQGIIS